MKNRSNKKAFTLVELLAVIVILAVILIIAVPRMLDIISDTRKSSFETAVKLIASSAEKKYTENKMNDITEEITCESVSKINSKDYETCEIVFEGDTAKVTAIGSGKFDGLKVIYGTKTSAIAITGEVDKLYTLEEAYQLINDLTARIEELENGTLTDASIADLKTTVKENKEAIENNKSLIDVNTTNINNCSTSVVNLTNKGSINNVFLKMYPIGSIYVSTNSTNPKDIFGGTWTQLKDRFLLGAGDTYTAGSTGGEATHKLTINEMPSHTHMSAFVDSNVTEQTTRANALLRASLDVGTKMYRKTENKTVLETGGNSAHNNMPPYLTVYMWKRTA